MIHTSILGDIEIQIWEIILLFAFVVLSAFMAFRYQQKKQMNNPAYKFFTWGILAKMVAGVAFAFIYIFYYDSEGDTFSYYETGLAFNNLFLENPFDFFEAFFRAPTPERRMLFNNDTGVPEGFIWANPTTLFVSKIVSVILAFSMGSYILGTVLTSLLCFFGAWRLYILLATENPLVRRQLAVAILFMPSVLFWSSGILKDSFVYAALCTFVSSTIYLIHRKSVLKNILLILLAGMIIVFIKPYILLILIPGTVIWMNFERIKRIRNLLVRILIVPFVIVIVLGGSFVALNSLGGAMGKFSIDSMFVTANESRKDLMQDYYEGNSFDIGGYDPNLAGALSKFPQATTAGLFRPFVWESKNVVMLLSGLENLFLLYFFILTIFKTGIFRSLKAIFQQPIILYCLLFSVVFAFMIGLSTSNFGALVRFKIQLIPFFLIGLIHMRYNKSKSG